jgi:hypothetical protein
MEFIPEGATVNKQRYKASWALAQEELAVATWQWPRTSLCACPRGAGKTTGHRFATPSILTWFSTMWFLSLSPLERKATWASISVGRGDRHCHKRSHTGPSWKYLSAVFPSVSNSYTNIGRLA